MRVSQVSDEKHEEWILHYGGSRVEANVFSFWKDICQHRTMVSFIREAKRASILKPLSSAYLELCCI